MEIFTLATVILSTIIAMFVSIGSLLHKETIKTSSDSFMYSFLGGLLGGFTGTIIGHILGYIVSLMIPSTSWFGFGDIEKQIGFLLVSYSCWLICTIVGSVKTINPLIQFFSNKNK